MTRSDTSDLFARCFTRIDRAVQHSNEVADAWNNFDVGGLHGVSLSIESDGTGELNVRQLEPLPQALEVSLGEYLYQLRAALDGAVYASAIEDSGQDPPPKVSSIEFPICDSSNDWPKQSRKIANLNPGRKRFIEAVQPFTEPSIDASLRIGNANRALRILNDLARIDRHRRPHTFVTTVSTTAAVLELPRGVTVRSATMRALSETDGPLMRFTLDGWRSGLEVHANPRADIDLSIDGIPPPCHSNDTFPNRLKSIVMNVRIIISLLEKNEWKSIDPSVDV